MTAEEKLLVRESFDFLERQADLVPLIFYQRLFTTAPILQPLFAGELEMQAVRFFSALHTIVHSLDDITRLRRFVEPLSERHRRLGLKPSHYENFGEALLWTLGEVLGRHATAETVGAWRAAYRLIVDLMLQHRAEELVAAKITGIGASIAAQETV